MAFMSWIVSKLNEVSSTFYSIYLEVYGWIFPFDLAATFFYNLSLFFNNLAWYFYDFSLWVYDTANKLLDILSEFDIWSILATPIQWASNAWNWVQNAWSNVWNVIEAWWSTTWYIVQAWVDEAKNYASTLVDEVSTKLVILQENWSNFVSSTLPNLASWSGVQSLIDSTFRSWFPFYDELVSLWSKIRDFFTDPLAWVYSNLDEFFERFW